jgi:hypothetical protein
MKPKTFVILSQCIEDGIKRGYRRAFKHAESPSEETILSSIGDCVIGSIYEFFTFEEDEV